jgi:hypothetical protein
MDGNTKFWVTRNLYKGLKSLRQPIVAQALWIDAICINQNDPEAKKIHIGLMRRVYRQAQNVVAYLPQSKEDTKSSTELADRIMEAYEKCTRVINAGNIRNQHIDVDEKGGNVTPIPEGSVALVHMIHLKPSRTCIEDHETPTLNDPAWGV